MQKRVLITGISGFAGSYLAEYLLAQGRYTITGTYLTHKSIQNVEHIQKKIELVQVDLTTYADLVTILDRLQPDIVYHLAALASPAESYSNPKETVVNNIAIQINLLEGLRKSKLFKTRILIVSSADVYGKVGKKDLPMDEETQFRPENPYAVSKISQDFLGLQYFLAYHMNIVRVRPFNHIGPRQSPNFVVSSFAKRIAEIEKGKSDAILKVGNLSAKRDFTDVRDIVRAYDLIIAQGEAGEVYNIGSGISYEISDILNKLLALSNKAIRLKVDSNLFRPSDTPELRCDYTKINRVTQWVPEISIDTTLKETLDYWRSIV